MNKKLFVSVAATASLLAGCVVVATPQHANFHQQKTLSIQANDLNRLTIEAGAGSLKVIGSDSETNVTVTGHIYTTKESPNAYDFSLDRNGQHAELVARNHSSSGYWHGNSPRIDLIISLPDGMALDIEDGSGGITVRNTGGLVISDAGSGSLTFDDIKGVIEVDS